MTTMTTDKHVANLSDTCITTPDGLRHYTIIVEQVPENARFDSLRDATPFYVTMCDLCDAYDAAQGWYDFTYPDLKVKEDKLERNFPTCARCSGA